MKWLRRLFCAHRHTITADEEWGFAYRCYDCGKTGSWWRPEA